MIYWLLGAIALDVLILIIGFPLQSKYLRHLRHHHRPVWEAMNQRASRRWRDFRGMPSTGLLITTYIGGAEYKTEETRGFLFLGRLVVLLNFLHIIALGAIVVLGVVVFVL